MQFTHETRTNIFFGAGCVQEHAKAWILGKRAFIVTGAHSGRKSGALHDITTTLEQAGTAYELFEGIHNNPTVEQCRELAARVREAGADFIVAVGGGSPLDAAKAIAVFACEEALSTQALFTNAFSRTLPVVAIPTTSGTGSEVTPFSVLTRSDLQSKFSFGTIMTVPAVALLDPGYTRSLSAKVTLDTALDAFTHCLEGVISVKATPVSDALALDALRRFGACIPMLAAGEYDSIRDALMLVSMLGGMTISKSGTTLMHGMGYPLTYYKGLTHGQANCTVMPGYLAFVQKAAPERLSLALNALGMDQAALLTFVKRCFPLTICVTEEEICHYAAQTMLQGSTRNIAYDITQETIEQIYREAFAAFA